MTTIGELRAYSRGLFDGMLAETEITSPPMKTFAVRHDGRWLRGYSVVVAEDQEQARQLLEDLLLKRGLKPPSQDPAVELHEVLPGTAYLLCDGDY